MMPSYLKDIIPPLRRSLYGQQKDIIHLPFTASASDAGTILEVNLRRYHLSPNLKKLYWLSFVQLKNPYLMFTTLQVSKNVFNCDWASAIWKVTKKIIISLTRLLICVFATLRLKILNIFFVNVLFSLFKGVS